MIGGGCALGIPVVSSGRIDRWDGKDLTAKEFMSTHGGPRFVRRGVCGDAKAERVGLAPASRPEKPAICRPI